MLYVGKAEKDSRHIQQSDELERELERKSPEQREVFGNVWGAF